MNDIAKLKRKFLRGMNEWQSVARKDEDVKRHWALDNTMLASVRRNPVYSPASGYYDRYDFRDSWKLALFNAGMDYEYKMKITDALHIKKIDALADFLSKYHGELLRDKRLRIGTSQKALNLYLKYLWCLDMISEPRHCPLDGFILKKAGVSGNWTQSDSIAEYKQWIAGCREAAGKESLAIWELRVSGEK